MADYLRVRGHQEIINVLKSIERKSATTICRKVARAGSKVFTAEAQSEAPKDTGFMASRINTRSVTQLGKGRVGTQTQIGVQNYVGKSFYGAFVAFGHHLGKRDLPDREFVEPDNFMLRAFENKGPELARKLPAMFWDEIAREVSRTKRINVR